MQLDIAVESVLTANGAMHALLQRLGRRAGRDASATAPASTPRRSRAACWTSRPTSASAAFCAGPAPLLRGRGLPARHPARRPAGAWHGRRDAGSRHRRAKPAASSTWRWTTARIRRCWSGSAAAIDGAREVAAREGLSAEVLPYDRAVHTPLFAPFAEDLRERLRGATGRRRRARRCGRARPRRLTRTTRRRSASCSSSTGRARFASARRSRRSTRTAHGCSSRSARAAT